MLVLAADRDRRACRADAYALRPLHPGDRRQRGRGARHGRARRSAEGRIIYTLSGALAGLAGLLFAARVNAGDPTAGLNYELTAITATIIGGTNLFGGRGSIVGTIIGALIMGVLQNGLNLLAVPSFYQQMAIGAVLVLAVWLDRINRSEGTAVMSLLELTDVRKNFGSIEALRGVDLLRRSGQRRWRWSATMAPASRR